MVVDIAFYYSFPRQKDWNDSDLEGSGLAGSETALVHISRELARRQHQVTVFNLTRQEGCWHGVRYRHLERLDYNHPWEVFIAVRGPVPDLGKIKARVKVYWSIEEDRTLVKDWRLVLPYVNAVFTISPFHTRELLWRCQLPPEIIYETRLGINLDEYAAMLPKVDNKLIYCSIPGRGLEHLARIFPLIQREIPHATLVITSDYTLWGRQPGNEAYRKLFRPLKAVNFLGKVPRARLIREQKTSVLHLYPCTVAELFCLPSIECQAAGTPTIAANLGALASTVQDGFSGLLLKGPASRTGFHQEFARAVVDVLQHPGRRQEMQRQARERAWRHYSYARIVSEWEGRFLAWRK